MFNFCTIDVSTVDQDSTPKEKEEMSFPELADLGNASSQPVLDGDDDNKLGRTSSSLKHEEEVDEKEVEGREKDGGITVEESNVSNEEEGSASNEDEGSASNEDEGRASNEEEGRASNEEEGRAYNEEEGRATNEEEGRASKEEEGSASNEEGRASKEGEGRASKEEEGSATNEGEGRASKEEEGSATNEGEGRAFNEEEGSASNENEGTYRLPIVYVTFLRTVIYSLFFIPTEDSGTDQSQHRIGRRMWLHSISLVILALILMYPTNQGGEDIITHNNYCVGGEI